MKILLINLPYYGHVVPTIGLGRSLDYHRISSEEIRNVTFKVMNDSTIRNAVDAMKFKMAESSGNQGGAEAIMEYYKEKVE